MDLQFRKHGCSRVILAGMSAKLCTESHRRDLVESGFDVCVVKDATAAEILSGLPGYKAALVNIRMIASPVFTTEEAVKYPLIFLSRGFMHPIKKRKHD